MIRLVVFLLFASAALASGGRVTMKRSAGAWSVSAPDGSAVSTAGTQTEGLQEAINFGVATGAEVDVVGSGVAIKCSTFVLFPSADGIVFRCAAPIAFSPGVSYALRFDSVSHSNIAFLGQITYQGSGGAAVSIAPTTPGVLVGGQPLFVDNRIFLQRVFIHVSASGLPCGLLMSPVWGTIARNRIEIGEIEGNTPKAARMGDGITVWSPANGWVFVGNDVSVGALLVWSGCAVRVGTTLLVSGSIRANTWTITADGGMPSSAGIYTRASCDVYRCSVSAPASQFGLLLDVDAANNLALMPLREGGVVNLAPSGGNVVIP